MLRRAWLAMALLAVAGCGGAEKPQWALKDISGLMPRLEFTLSSQDGRAVNAGDFRGKVTMLFFGYTHCPDVCPTTLGMLSQALADLGTRADAVRVLFVTVDPQRDTLAVLRQYTALFGPQFVGLRGSDDQLEALAKRFRVGYSRGEPDANGSYPVTHSSAVFIFDREGEARLLGRGSDSAEAVAHDLERMV